MKVLLILMLLLALSIGGYALFSLTASLPMNDEASVPVTAVHATPATQPTISVVPPSVAPSGVLLTQQPLPPPVLAQDNGKSARMAIPALPVPPIPESLQTALAKELATLKKNPKDPEALIAVFTTLIANKLEGQAVPFIEGFLQEGYELYPTGQRNYALGLATLQRFDEALAVLKKLGGKNGGFPGTESYTVTVNMRRCIYAIDVSQDIVEASAAFVSMNSCAPNALYLDDYDATCNKMMEAIYHSARLHKLDAAMSKIDAMWAFLPSIRVRQLIPVLKAAGIEPSRAMQNACDDMNPNGPRSSAALIRRSIHVVSRARNFEGGMMLADSALETARQQNDKNGMINALLCVANLALQRGELEKLFSTVTEAYRLTGDHGQAGRVAQTTIWMGRTFEALGDYRAAAEEYAKAEQIVQANQESWPNHMNPESLFNHLRCLLGQADQVEGYMREQADFANRTAPGPGLRCVPFFNLGTCLSREKKFVESNAAFRRSMESNDFDYRVLSSIEIGRNYLALNNPKQAEAAFAETEQYEQMITNREARWAWQFGRAQSRRMQADLPGAQANLDEALKTIEEQRASLKDYNCRRSLQDNKYGVYEFAIEMALGRRDETGAFALAERARSRTFLDALGSQSGTVQATPLADMARLQSVCKGFVAVVYFQCKENVLVWIVRHDGFEMITLPLPEQPLFDEIQQFRASLWPDRLRAGVSKNSKDADWKTVSQSLYRSLWAPINKRLHAGERVCIIPHRTLHYIPFQALHDGSTFLIDGRDIFYAPSGSSLVELSAHKAVPATGMVVFDPICSPDPKSPFHITETESIHRTFPQMKVATGKDATVSAFKRDAVNAGVIHISSHGSFNPWIPVRSGLHFAESGDNGTLTAADVFKMKLTGAPLVVMSACVSSVGELSDGDEVTGLTRAFQVAGARNVIGSLWPVDNAATTRLMGIFYDEFKQNSADPVAAFCKAQRRFLATEPAPAKWAAFELNGVGLSGSR